MALASPLFHSQADSVPVELYFQIGLHREVMTIQRSDLHLTRLTEVACYLVESQVRFFDQLLYYCKLFDCLVFIFHTFTTKFALEFSVCTSFLFNR